MDKILLACDLNRTVLPDGLAPSSKEAFRVFSKFTSRPNVYLAYMTGMHLTKAVEAVNKYNVLLPKYFVCDVGTSIYIGNNDKYILSRKWKYVLDKEWKGIQQKDIVSAILKIPNIKLQEEENQGKHKVSFYFPFDTNEIRLKEKAVQNLSGLGLSFSVITSVNHIDKVGYLDILPTSANKLQALKFLQEKFFFDKERVVFAGDSGNDIEPLTSRYKAIVVGNAENDFKERVKEIAIQNGVTKTIYFAKGGYINMNGNYAAGIIEGLHHFGFI